MITSYIYPIPYMEIDDKNKNNIRVGELVSDPAYITLSLLSNELHENLGVAWKYKLKHCGFFYGFTFEIGKEKFNHCLFNKCSIDKERKEFICASVEFI